MGLSFTVDSPLKVAAFGIASAVSLGSDALLEDMRAYYSNKFKLQYNPISTKEEDYRARRITAYLNMLSGLVKQKFEELRRSSLQADSDLTRYLDMLPKAHPLKALYFSLRSAGESERPAIEQGIRNAIEPGSVDVNIMTKLNKPGFDSKGNKLPGEYADALAALRGYARSELTSAIIFSAGFNARLYSYLEQFDDFYPDARGFIRKKVILKVSDYRSAIIQGKFLAKKGIWVSEFRVESGLNCGGHAFATDGILMGPILREFQNNRMRLQEELFALCKPVWDKRNPGQSFERPELRLTVQGGIGTGEEHRFLMDHYGVDATGWGTPFLLVPEATTVDSSTLEKLMAATAKDLYLSKSSPLGVPFNNLRGSDSERQREARMVKNRPGSPCLKKYLVSNTEFTTEPICTASRQYQHLKLKQLREEALSEDEFRTAADEVVLKSCLCEDLAATAYVDYDIKPKLKPASSICPGPNLAFFSGQYSLREMIANIYGEAPALTPATRPHVFINELKLYIDYLHDQWSEFGREIQEKKEAYLQSFRLNLEKGIQYYRELAPTINSSSFSTDLEGLTRQLQDVGAKPIELLTEV